MRRSSMARISMFNSPLLLGFDHFERALDRVQKAQSDGYPPYNIEQTSDFGLRITLAVAGFDMDDLEVHLENNQLVVRGRQVDDDGKVYLHRGIAARQFLRTFVLAEGIQVESAELDNGLLHIDLQRLLPETTLKNIPINGGRRKKAINLEAEAAEAGD
ncbi:Heat shock protein Hsp20 [Candidatus Endolissoclinum faulkneri L5]|uniref:Heat shock protein Hsp20 n=2 Tax=Candidatus Endolissoclinum faulkneri TaxID=1263979 RepID=V9TSC1_9PROT|nr:Heat shock protein Hsp20 [Candidatus Endolissoclinum faulkneri L5]